MAAKKIAEKRGVLERCGIDTAAPGVVVAADAADASFAGSLVEAIGWHRHWARAAVPV